MFGTELRRSGSHGVRVSWGLGTGASVFLVLLSATVIGAERELTIDDVRLLVTSSIDQVRVLSAAYTFRTETLQGDLPADSLGSGSEVKWKYCPKDKRQRFEETRYANKEGRPVYDSSIRTYDGKRHWHFQTRPGENGHGTITEEGLNSTLGTPWSFITRYEIFDWTVINEPSFDVVGEEVGPEGRRVVVEGQHHGWWVRVSYSVAWGFLPARVELRTTRAGELFMMKEIQEAREAAPGIYMPVKIRGVLPSENIVNVWRVDEIQVNGPVNEHDFRIEWPHGTLVQDTPAGLKYRVGGALGVKTEDLVSGPLDLLPPDAEEQEAVLRTRLQEADAQLEDAALAGAVATSPEAAENGASSWLCSYLPALVAGLGILVAVALAVCWRRRRGRL